jgi:hypothetical protein
MPGNWLDVEGQGALTAYLGELYDTRLSVKALAP